MDEQHPAPRAKPARRRFHTDVVTDIVGYRLRRAPVSVVTLAALPLVWEIMHDYQKRRVLAFLWGRVRLTLRGYGYRLRDESQVALHFNLGLAHLAKGELETAREVYEGGIAQAIAQVTAAKGSGEAPPASLWWYLGTPTGAEWFRNSLQ